MKDSRVRYNQAEKYAVQAFRARAFCLARKNLTAATMAQLFLGNIDAVTRACREHEHGLFVVTESGLRRVPLYFGAHSIVGRAVKPFLSRNG